MRRFVYKQKGKDYYHRLWHTPEKNIFLFVQSGEGILQLKERSYPLSPGTLCFIGESMYHYVLPSDPSEYVRSKIFLEGEVLSGISELFSDSDLASRFGAESAAISALSEKDRERVSYIFESLKDLPTDSVYGKEEVTSAAIQLMLILSKSALTEANVSSNSLQSAINFITQHIYEELTIDVISEACYMNKYHLCRTFKKKLGCTVMEYVLQTRLAMAKELLEKSDSSITNVSVLSGFSSPAYFSRVFSEHVGLSPSAYKKKYKS